MTVRLSEVLSERFVVGFRVAADEPITSYDATGARGTRSFDPMTARDYGTKEAAMQAAIAIRVETHGQVFAQAVVVVLRVEEVSSDEHLQFWATRPGTGLKKPAPTAEES